MNELNVRYTALVKMLRNNKLEMLIDLNVIQCLLNDIKMKVQHHDLVLTIVIHHYEILFDDDDVGNASIKKKGTSQTQRKEKKQERKSKRKEKRDIVF